MTFIVIRDLPYHIYIYKGEVSGNNFIVFKVYFERTPGMLLKRKTVFLSAASARAKRIRQQEDDVAIQGTEQREHAEMKVS